MKLRICSDLHLEFSDLVLPELEDDKDTILLLAGDIGVVEKQTNMTERFIPFLARASHQFRYVILILGNHEHYGGSFVRTASKLLSYIGEQTFEKNNVILLEKETRVIDDVAFIGATLWTDCNKQSPHALYLFNSMADSRVIRTGPNKTLPYERKFRAPDTWVDHMYAKQYIWKAIDEQKAQGHKVVVMTHHAPSQKSVADQYIGNELNMFFHSNLDLDIMEHAPNLWVHGHMHNVSDYRIDESRAICDTRVVCNPRGYDGHEVTGWNPEFIIDTDNI